MTTEATGIQHRLSDDGVSAHIAQVGASLRGLVVAGVEIVPPYPDGVPTPAASGLVLVPWPNRVRDGVWTQRGVAHRLAITEPEKGNASHGLLRYTPYDLVARDAASVTLAATVFPQAGYPFLLDTTVTYAIVGMGLEVTHTVTNAGADAAPVALGAHPYLWIGDAPADALTLQVDAATMFPTDERSLPTGEAPVDAEHDLRAERPVAGLRLDTAYGTIARDGDDRIRAFLRHGDGRSVELWADAGFDYLQVFTTDRYPGRPAALAVEPMTAPADALNSGQGLRWLAPGETWTLRWGITARV